MASLSEDSGTGLPRCTRSHSTSSWCICLGRDFEERYFNPGAWKRSALSSPLTQQRSKASSAHSGLLNSPHTDFCCCSSNQKESEQRERFSREKMSHRRKGRGGSVISGLYLSCDSTLKAIPGRISLSHKYFASSVHSVTSTGCTGKIKHDYYLIIMRSVQPEISNNPT